MATSVTKFSPRIDCQAIAAWGQAPPAWPRAAVLCDSLLVDAASAGRLLAMLQGRVSLAVTSSTPAEPVMAALRRCSLQSLLPVVVSAKEAGMQERKPKVCLEACRRLGVDPSDAIAFEDSAAGACAAQAAGLTVVVVSCDLEARAIGDLATSRIDDPRVLEMFGLSRARSRGLASCLPLPRR